MIFSFSKFFVCIAMALAAQAVVVPVGRAEVEEVDCLARREPGADDKRALALCF